MQQFLPRFSLVNYIAYITKYPIRLSRRKRMFLRKYGIWRDHAKKCLFSNRLALPIYFYCSIRINLFNKYLLAFDWLMIVRSIWFYLYIDITHTHTHSNTHTVFLMACIHERGCINIQIVRVYYYYKRMYLSQRNLNAKFFILPEWIGSWLFTHYLNKLLLVITCNKN